MNRPLPLIAGIVLLFLLGCSTGEKRADGPGHIGLDPLPVQDVTFFSESLQREMHINVVLPRDYVGSDTRYPVLYFCHGLTSNYHEFKYVGVPEYLNLFDMIAVMVDVGNSWYVNWATSEGGMQNHFSDHVTKDVIGYVDSHYRTVAERNGRAVSGISMGGFGALSVGLTHPELFCSIASLSGAVGWAKMQTDLMKKGQKPWIIWEEALKDTLTRYRDIDIEGYSSLPERTPKGKIFEKPADAARVDPFTLVTQIPREALPHIYLDCGTDDGLIKSARDFMDLLLANDIPFQYGQSGGGHEEDYWGRELILSMSVQYSVMLRNLWGREFKVYDAWAK